MEDGEGEILDRVYDFDTKDAPVRIITNGLRLRDPDTVAVEFALDRPDWTIYLLSKKNWSPEKMTTEHLHFCYAVPRAPVDS